ncbi:hypothetical protein [Novosphingobium mangrovi (ex Huang et al. 2023)]|uniref:Uncharacterized protein n=1 Tax=Novosphingobium mangrovi (ex Huang et al. 2023) TaxID=2976432 RepID=A0ABT2I6X6_9SPHN|nr:hypothetical protein [Novosphingobium mangrovi (ex Huang et al. 2023)]MCT2400560.1 hypothetical protein [Novosphingobium mangrovi (ex Huang et al. 2023)]
MTRRALVLTHEAAGHPFRQSLPQHVFTEPLGIDVEAEENAQAARRWRMTGGDWRGFLAAYCASFVAVSIFIA